MDLQSTAAQAARYSGGREEYLGVELGRGPAEGGARLGDGEEPMGGDRGSHGVGVGRRRRRERKGEQDRWDESQSSEGFFFFFFRPEQQLSCAATDQAVWKAQDGPFAYMGRNFSNRLLPSDKVHLAPFRPNIIRTPLKKHRIGRLSNYWNQCDLTSPAVLKDGFANVALTWRCLPGVHPMRYLCGIRI